MSYPGSIDSFTPKVDDVDDVLAAYVNALQVATAAIETELGTDPAGSQTDVKTRLAHLMSAAGFLEFDQETLLTITGGAITVAQNLHRIETEAGAASDNLDTINGHSNGLFLIVRASNDAHTVVIRHDEGNILCTGGANISLDSTDELAWGYYDGTLSKWILMRGLSGEALTGAGVDNQVAVFTGASTLDSSAKLTFTGTQLISGSDSYPVSSVPKIIAMSEDSWGAIGVLGYGGAYISTYTAAGNKASPTATQADDLLGRWVGGGYDAADDWAAFSASIEMYATENFDGSSHGSKIFIKATEDGSISPATVITVEGDKVTLDKPVEITRQLLVDGSSDEVQLKVQAHSTQTANIVEVQDSGANVHTHIDGNADLIVEPIANSTTTFQVNQSDSTNVLVVDTTNARVGIGTTPGFAFDVVGGANGGFQLSSVSTDATIKRARMYIRHYTNAEEPVIMFAGIVTSSLSQVHFGGGSTIANVATDLFFFTAANNTTLIGTQAMKIDNMQRVMVGAGNPLARLHILGSTDDQQLIVQAHSTQTANIQEWQSSASAILAKITKTGGALFGDKVQFTQTDGNEYIDSLADGYLDIDATTAIRMKADVSLDDGKNIILNTTTGTKIGTATNQKLGFYNATPIVQPTVTGATGGNAALANLLMKLEDMGLIVDSTT